MDVSLVQVVVAAAGAGIALFLMLAARPLSVVPLPASFRFGAREP